MTVRVSAALLDLADRPHVLYRFFDRTDVLLYVGITVDLTARMAKHEREKFWWGDVAYARWETIPNRAAAFAAEKAAIQADRPLYNDQHNETFDLDLVARWVKASEPVKPPANPLFGYFGLYDAPYWMPMTRVRAELCVALNEWGDDDCCQKFGFTTEFDPCPYCARDRGERYCRGHWLWCPEHHEKVMSTPPEQLVDYLGNTPKIRRSVPDERFPGLMPIGGAYFPFEEVRA